MKYRSYASWCEIAVVEQRVLLPFSMQRGFPASWPVKNIEVLLLAVKLLS